MFVIISSFGTPKKEKKMNTLMTFAIHFCYELTMHTSLLSIACRRTVSLYSGFVRVSSVPYKCSMIFS